MYRRNRPRKNYATWVGCLLLILTMLTASSARAQETFPREGENLNEIHALERVCSPVCEVCIRRYKETCSLYQRAYKTAERDREAAVAEANRQRGKMTILNRQLTQERRTALRLLNENQALRKEKKERVRPLTAFSYGFVTAVVLGVATLLLVR